MQTSLWKVWKHGVHYFREYEKRDQTGFCGQIHRNMLSYLSFEVFCSNGLSPQVSIVIECIAREVVVGCLFTPLVLDCWKVHSFFFHNFWHVCQGWWSSTTWESRIRVKGDVLFPGCCFTNRGFWFFVLLDRCTSINLIPGSFYKHERWNSPSWNRTRATKLVSSV